jgi:hypothetical protein
MTETTRRTFLQSAAVVGATMAAAPAFAQSGRPAAAAPTVPLTWLEGAPKVPAGVAFGVPWPRGALARGSAVGLRSARGAIPAQTWPLAYWPDGSIKWTGFAIAGDDSLTGDLSVVPGAASPAPATPVTVRDSAQAVEVSTGPLVCRIGKSGRDLVQSMVVDGRQVAQNGRLVALREDRSSFAKDRSIKEVEYASRISKVTVEQSGPVRAVIKIEGKHAALQGSRQWLPFIVRLYFTAGLESVRMVHSFIFDGDQKTDYIKGLGLVFGVPFREELQNRHIRFATDGDHLFSEPVLMAPGYRRSAEMVARQKAQLEGKRIPNLAEMTQQERTSFGQIAQWDSYKLNQLGPDSFSIAKRTNPDSSWTHITNGNRARGLVYFGDVSGGLAVSVKRFWQKYPSSVEVSGGAAKAGELKVWFWAPDAVAMDVRHYDTIGHAQATTYEDYEEGNADANGAANTAELTLWATRDTPDPVMLDAMAKTGNAPPILVCPPQHYYDTHTLGVWSLPGKPAPGLTAAEIASADTQLDRAVAFFEGEVERRKWYGFWDFGDFRRTYDPIRHEWMYDIGGHGWNATELMPEAWLWQSFLRSGRADIFRLAENMTRATTEIAVYHSGKFAGLGSRHNVSHWGDGAKESRINQAFLKRFYYYLTTDERMGDLIREPLALMENAVKKTPPLRKVLPRPDLTAFPPIRIGPDWFAWASNWMAEWERTGDVRYRDYILTGMKDLGAMPDAMLVRGVFGYDPATKHLRDIGDPNNRPSHFTFVFAGDYIVDEIMQLIDWPPFVEAWNRLCVQFARVTPGSGYFQSRIVAYAGMVTGEPALQARALELFRGELKFGNGEHFPATLTPYTGPGVTSDVKETPGNSSFTPAPAVPEVAQWGLNVMSSTEYIRRFKSGQPVLAH